MTSYLLGMQPPTADGSAPAPQSAG
jgi:hypothetical protein